MTLVGREQELLALRDLLRQHRLVTVCGPAGVGKSRLVREVVGAEAKWCSLGAARSTSQVERALARALGAEPTGAPLASSVARALSRSQQPIVLDDADLAAKTLHALLPRWLSAAKQAHFVVTARARLELDSEQSLELAPLEPSAAVSLWLSTLRRHGHDADPALAPAIVARLDGLPMAIEWFAPRAALLGDAACLERLRRFEDAESPLAAALDQSLDSLSETEQEALAHIVTFEEGAPASALDRLVGSGLNTVDGLARRALVRIEPGTPARITAYRAVIKRMRSRQAHRWDELTRAHANVVLEQTEQREGEPPLAQQALAAERSELAAIADRFADEPALALRACLAWVPLSFHDGTAETTAALLRKLIARLPEVPSEAVLALGRLQRSLGAFDDARRHLEMAHQGSDRFEAQIELAHLDRMQSRSEQALSGYEAALSWARQHGSDAQRCIAAGELGRMLQSIGRFRDAQQQHERAIVLARSLGLHNREALERSLYARATHRAGRVRQAIPMHEQALALHRRLRQKRLAGAELGHLGYCHHEIGNLERAEASFRSSVAQLADVGDVVLESIERVLLARLLSDRGRHAEAKLELAIADDVSRDVAMPRLTLTRLFVAGLVANSEGEAAAARSAWQSALSLGLHLEVGFEALLPAHLALLESQDGEREAARRHLEQSLSAVAGFQTPGLSAALEVLAAAVRAEPIPPVAANVLSSSSDARRALALVQRAGAATTLRIADDGRRFVLPDGTSVELGRRAAPRRLLLALARAHRSQPGTALDFDALIAAGWPGERMRSDAARKRLRTAIWTLRKLGLEPLLLTGDDGYLLAPAVAVEMLG